MCGSPRRAGAVLRLRPFDEGTNGRQRTKIQYSRPPSITPKPGDRPLRLGGPDTGPLVRGRFAEDRMSFCGPLRQLPLRSARRIPSHGTARRHAAVVLWVSRARSAIGRTRIPPRSCRTAFASRTAIARSTSVASVVRWVANLANNSRLLLSVAKSAYQRGFRRIGAQLL
jgi:hypothetical protein